MCDKTSESCRSCKHLFFTHSLGVCKRNLPTMVRKIVRGFERFLGFWPEVDESTPWCGE